MKYDLILARATKNVLKFLMGGGGGIDDFFALMSENIERKIISNFSMEGEGGGVLKIAKNVSSYFVLSTFVRLHTILSRLGL